jgi:hypothetical protein
MGIEVGYDVAVDPNKLRSDMFLMVRDLELRKTPHDIVRAYIAAFDFVLSCLDEDLKLEEDKWKEVKHGKQKDVHEKDC